MLGIGLSACEELFVPDIDSQTTHLVFDGFISDQEEIQQVNISRSVAYNSSSIFNAATGFTVQIEDNFGQVISLVEDRNTGKYYSELKVKGLYNHQYRLVATSPEGKTYISTFESMQRAAPINEITGSYNVKQWLEKVDGIGYVEHNEEGMYAQANCNFSAYTPFYRYEHQIVYLNSQVYPTKPYSTAVYIARPANSFSKGLIAVANGNLYTNKKIVDFPVDFFKKSYMEREIILDSIERDSAGNEVFDKNKIQYNQSGLLIQLKQYSLSEVGFNFWNAIYNQQQSSGQLFDPVESQIVGNISCESDSTEMVFGYFGASSVTMLNRHMYLAYNKEVLVQPIDTFPQLDGMIASYGKFYFWVSY